MARQFSDMRQSVSQGNVQSPIFQPLTHKYPCSMEKHDYGVLYGIHPNPPKFYPADSTNTVSINRYQYIKTNNPLNAPFIINKTKYITPQCSSLRTQQLKSTSIGKSGYKIGLSNEDPLSYKNYNRNDVRTSLRMARSSGCIVPKKCTSIYNNVNRNGVVWAWGEIPRDTY